jgi:hypothetical protein
MAKTASKIPQRASARSSTKPRGSAKAMVVRKPAVEPEGYSFEQLRDAVWKVFGLDEKQAAGPKPRKKPSKK